MNFEFNEDTKTGRRIELLLIVVSLAALFWLYEHNKKVTQQTKEILSKTSQLTTKPFQTQVKEPVGQPSSPSFVVKGLYIGMPVSTLEAVVQDKFGGDWVVQDRGLYERDPKKHWYEINSDKLLHTLSNPDDIFQYNVEVFSDPNSGLVNEFIFHDPAANDLFNASSLDASAFTDMFMHAYNIPKMDGHKGYWEYRKDDLRIRITTDKAVQVLQIIPTSEVQRSFN